MTTHVSTASPASGGKTLLSRLGLPKALLLGYLGLLLFMVGDGVEAGFIAPFLVNNGAGNETGAANIITVYGIAVMFASWLSGALSQLWGPRRVMIIGLIIWLVFDALFLAVAVTNASYELMLITYGIRGFGYPLFAYSFLVWVTAAAPRARLGAAVGWYYFAFTGGLPTLGALLASFSTPVLGHLGTLWLSLVILAAGGVIAILGVRERTGSKSLAPEEIQPLKSLLSSVSLAWQRPRVGLGALARMINSTPQFGLFVFFPSIFADQIGFGEGAWLQLVAIMFGSCILFNLLSGLVSDKLGWRNTVFWFGSIGCAITFPMLYFVPVLLGKDFYWAALIAGILYGMSLAGWVPISALVPSMAPDNKGGAMALLNLGAGASAFVGPALVGILLVPIGPANLVLVFSGLYLLSAILVHFCKLPDGHEQNFDSAEGVEGSATSALAANRT